MPTLRNLKVKFGSLVDEPANMGSRVLLFKTHDTVSKPGWDQNSESFRFRVREPDTFIAGSLRTTQITRGVRAVVGRQVEKGPFQIQSLIFARSAFAKLDDAKQFLASHPDLKKDIEKIGRKIKGTRLTQLSDVVRILQTLLSEVGDEPSMAKEINKDALTPEVKEYVEQLETQVANQNKTLEANTQKISELTATVSDLEKSQEEPEGEDVLKNLSPEVRKVVEAAQNQAKEAEEKAVEAEKIAKAEREQRVSAEWVEKAKGFEALSQTPGELGPMLKVVAGAMEPETFEKFLEMLRGANEQLKESALYKEVGKSTEQDSVSAMAQLESKAEDFRKENPRLTKEQAFTKALDANPELYSQYRSEIN